MKLIDWLEKNPLWVLAAVGGLVAFHYWRLHPPPAPLPNDLPANSAAQTGDGFVTADMLRTWHDTIMAQVAATYGQGAGTPAPAPTPTPSPGIEKTPGVGTSGIGVVA